MRKRSAILSAMFGILLAASQAHATPCDDPVGDGASVLSSADRARVDAAVGRLVHAGADVRVRLVQTFRPYGNLDQLEAAMLKDCPSWQAPSGGTKSNLLVFMRSIGDRKTGLYFGKELKPALDGRWNGAIQPGIPMLKAGDYAGGTVAVLDGVGSLLATRPSATTPSAPAPPPVVEHRTVVQTQPTDFHGLWIVMGAIVGLAAVAGLLIFLLTVSRSRGKRRAAQQKAKADKTSCSGIINELDDPLKILEARISNLASVGHLDEVRAYRDQRENIASAFHAAVKQYGDLDQSAVNPDREGLSEEEYAAMSGSFGEVLKNLRKARADLQRLETDVEAYKGAARASSAAIDGLAQAIAEAASAVEATFAMGYDVDGPEGILAQANACLTSAQSAIADKRFNAAQQACANGAAKASQAKSAAAKLARWKEDIQALISAAEERIANAKLYLTTHGKETDSRKQELSLADQQVMAAKGALAAAAPRFKQAEETAKAAQGKADGVIAEATAEVQQAEQVRQAAARRQQRARQRRQSSGGQQPSGGSSDDAFLGGLAGGVIGSAIGRSFEDERPTHGHSVSVSPSDDAPGGGSVDDGPSFTPSGGDGGGDGGGGGSVSD